MNTLFWIAVGVVIGWHVPQPVWATMAIEKVKSWFKSETES